MAWIESNEELATHPKTKRAARMLEISTVTTIGHLHFLWWWCLKYAQDGDLSQYDNQDIADAAGWEGDPNQFVQALLDCGPGDSAGFLEKKEENGLIIHDWMDYAGRLIEKRQANTVRMRKARAKHVQSTCEEHAGATVPNLTIPKDDDKDDDNARTREESSKREDQEDDVLHGINTENSTQTHISNQEIIGFQAIQFAQDNFSRPLVPYERKIVISWCKKIQAKGATEANAEAVVIEGLRRCVDNDAKKMRYLERIMSDWLNHGVKCLEDIPVIDAKWSAQQKRMRASPANSSRIRSQQKQVKGGRTGAKNIRTSDSNNSQNYDPSAWERAGYTVSGGT